MAVCAKSEVASVRRRRRINRGVCDFLSGRSTGSPKGGRGPSGGQPAAAAAAVRGRRGGSAGGGRRVLWGREGKLLFMGGNNDL